MIADAEILRKNYLFQDVPTDVLERLADRLQHRKFKADQTIFLEGAPGNALFLIVEGEVRISILSPTNENLTLALLYPGDTFGELSLFDDQDRRSATATATMDTMLLVIYHDDFQQAVENDPAAFRSFLKVMADLIRRMNERIKTVAMLGIPGRVAKVFLDMAARHGAPHPDGIKIDHELSYEDIAGLSLMYRGDVMHVMEGWQLEKYLYLEDDRWVIARKDVLEFAAAPS